MQDQAHVADKVIGALKELAGAAGQATETLWPMAVKATFASGVSTLVAMLALAILGIFVVKWAIHIDVRESRVIDDFGKGLFCFLGFVCIVIGFMVGSLEGLPLVIAPEGYTLLKILGK